MKNKKYLVVIMAVILLAAVTAAVFINKKNNDSKGEETAGLKFASEVVANEIPTREPEKQENTVSAAETAPELIEESRAKIDRAPKEDEKYYQTMSVIAATNAHIRDSRWRFESLPTNLSSINHLFLFNGKLLYVPELYMEFEQHGRVYLSATAYLLNDCTLKENAIVIKEDATGHPLTVNIQNNADIKWNTDTAGKVLIELDKFHNLMAYEIQNDGTNEYLVPTGMSERTDEVRLVRVD